MTRKLCDCTVCMVDSRRSIVSVLTTLCPWRQGYVVCGDLMTVLHYGGYVWQWFLWRWWRNESLCGIVYQIEFSEDRLFAIVLRHRTLLTVCHSERLLHLGKSRASAYIFSIVPIDV